MRMRAVLLLAASALAWTPQPAAPAAAAARRRPSRRTRLSLVGGEASVDVFTDLAAGVTGGTVGVVGTLIALEIKKKKVQSRSSCPYCTPGPTPGRLACAECLGTGLLLGVDGDTKTKCVCPRCNGRRTVVCVNCKGDGRALPTILDAKVSRDPETEMEEVGMG